MSQLSGTRHLYGGGDNSIGTLRKFGLLLYRMGWPPRPSSIHSDYALILSRRGGMGPRLAPQMERHALQPAASHPHPHPHPPLQTSSPSGYQTLRKRKRERRTPTACESCRRRKAKVSTELVCFPCFTWC